MASSARAPLRPTVGEVRSLGVETSEICFNAWDDNGNGLIDEGCGVHQGQVQVTLSWDESDADVDLFVTDPDGQIARANMATGLGLTLTADCPANESGCVEQPFENVYLERPEVPQGKFLVRARLERKGVAGQALSARLGIREPGSTRAFAIEFFEEGQEVLLDFVVDSHPASAETQVDAPPSQDEKVHQP